MLVEDRLEAHSTLAVDRQQVTHVVQRLRAVAEDQPDLRVNRDAGPFELVGVRRELQQRGDLGVARELGVEDCVGVATSHQEVGPAVEPAVEERPLEHDVGTAAQGRQCLVEPGQQRRCAVVAGHRDLRDAARAGRGPGAVGFAVVGEHPGLVRLAEVRDALEHGVALGLLHHAAELAVERAQHGELAPGRGREIAGGVDDRVVDQEHGIPVPVVFSTLRAAPDNALAAQQQQALS